MAKQSSVTAPLAYLKPGEERPFTYIYEPPNGEPWDNWR